MSKDEYYKPTNNYERNFMETKKFCGKLTILILPVLLIISIICLTYLALVSEEALETHVINFIFSKLNLDFEIHITNTVFSIIEILIFGCLAFAFTYIFFTGRSQTFDSSPEPAFAVLHIFSKIELIAAALAFVFMMVFTAMFMFCGASRFESIGEKFNMSVTDMEAYKVSILIILFFIDIILFFFIWYAQSQVNFITSIRRCLNESILRDKGARVYGVFSMSIGIVLLCAAALCTYMCSQYGEVMTDMGISLETTYVRMSLISMYSSALFPFVLGISSFSFSSMVESVTMFGGLYTSFTTIGSERDSVSDPNMHRNRI